MKLLPALFASAGLSAVLASASTVYLMEFADDAPRAEAEPAQREPTAEVARPTQPEPEPAALVAALDPEEAERVQMLEARVAELERRLASSRREVEVPEAGVDIAAAPIDSNDPAARQLVLDVMAQEEERERAEREARRAEQRLEQMNERADRIAEKVGLAEGERGELVEVLLAVDEQRDAARDTMRESGFDGARDSFRAIDDYKAEELTRRFGADLATAIEEADSRRGRGRGGRGGF
ncbi:MAG: hypothetical protein AAF682_28365 [Planctomycetota bacterium]